MKTRLILGAAVAVLLLGVGSAAQAADCAQTKASAAADAAMLELLNKTCKAVANPALDATTMAPVAAEALVSSTRSTAAQPVAGREVTTILAGTGSATLVPVYSYDAGVSYKPRALAVDGGAPIYPQKVTYDGSVQNGLILKVNDTVAGYRVAWLPGVVTGSVTIEMK